MSQDNSGKQDFYLSQLLKLADELLQREKLTEQGNADLGFIKFYAKELAGCKDCAKELPQFGRLRLGQRNKISK